ncbi:histidine--tRNA ligase [Patescibacteria group bacterium]|nr:histidine--tRNA ligase [Patescibacteria group bacterium]
MAKKIKFQSPKGMHDIVPASQPYWHHVISTFEEIAIFSGYQKINTSLVESIDLFTHTVGETSDIVSKEMFVLETKKENKSKYVLRPELTAPIARAYIQHGLKTMPKPVKLYTYGPLFRYDRPQAGRLRQHHQLDLEQIGTPSSTADAELISLIWQLFNKLDLTNIELHINTIGNLENRKNLMKLLINYFLPFKNQLCADCRQRLKKNPLRILDCKQKTCQKIIEDSPQLIDHVDKESKKHFSELLDYLDELEIPYTLDPKLVRGLDYYTKTVFEFISIDDGYTLGGGGRYDELIGMLGGEKTPAVGAGIGIERIILKLISQGYKPEIRHTAPQIFLIQLGATAKKKCFKLLHELRSKGLRVSCSLNKKSISSQLKLANRQKSDLALIIGQKEAIDNTVILRDMRSGVQDIIDWDNTISEISKRLDI